MGQGFNLFQDKIMTEDFEFLCKNETFWNEFKNTTILVTGATGLIGSYIVKALLFANLFINTNIQIIAFIRNPEKANIIFGNVIDNKKLKLVIGDISLSIDVPEHIDFIIHGACMTSSKEFTEKPLKTICSIIDGTRNILQFALKKKIKSMIYLSSLEVYGSPNAGLSQIKEKDYGYIDHLKPRSSYPIGKLISESMCSAYVVENQLNIKIARLSQTFGPGVSKNDNRVFAQFAQCVLNRQDIVLYSRGETIRSYCYLRDCISALLILLIKGDSGEAYNISNSETTCSIKEMAELVVKQYPQSGIQILYQIEEEIERLGYLSTVEIRQDCSKMMALGWYPTVNLSTAFDRMIQSMQQN